MGTEDLFLRGSPRDHPHYKECLLMTQNTYLKAKYEIRWTYELYEI